MDMRILPRLRMMKGNFGNHAGINQVLLRPIHCRLELGLSGQFRGNRQNEFACKLSIHALLARLDRVPKLVGIDGPGRSASGCQNHGFNYPLAPASVVKDFILNLIPELRSGAVSGSSDDGPTSFLTAKNFRFESKECHLHIQSLHRPSPEQYTTDDPVMSQE